VMGLLLMNNGLAPLGSLIFGTLAEIYGVRTAILVAGICGMSSVTFILTRFPSIRRYRSAAVTEQPVAADSLDRGEPPPGGATPEPVATVT